MIALAPRATLAAATVLAALVLFAAHGSEIWGGLVPCALCLVERWPYRAAIAFGVLGLVLPPIQARIATSLFIVAMLAGAAAGLTHVGVEQLWWKSPLPECVGPDLAGKSIAERLAAMPERPGKPCDEPTYLIPFLPVSMAMMNLIFCLGVAGVVLIRRR